VAELKRPTAVLRAAMVGGEVWLAYAALECGRVSLLQLMKGLDAEPAPLHPAFVLLLFLLYPAVGAGAGIVGALAARRLALSPGPAGRLPATLSAGALVVAFAANAFVHMAGSLDTLDLAFALWGGLLVLLVAALFQPTASPWQAGVPGPWTIPLLLLGSAWLLAERLPEASVGNRAAALLAWVAVLLLAARLLAARPGVRSGVQWGGRVLVVLLFWVAVLLPQPNGRQPVRSIPEAAHAPARPNVLLITLDTVRADHLSVYGYPRETTPALESLAREATLFTHCIAAGNMTLATHASLLTGLYPYEHGAHDSPEAPLGVPLDAGQTTLAEILAAHGYQTSAVVANAAYLAPHFGLAQGFQHYDARRPRRFLALRTRYTLARGVRSAILYGLLSRRERPDQDRWYRSAAELNRAALAEIDQLAAHEKPFLLFLNYMDAHDPYAAPEPFAARLAGSAEPMGIGDLRELQRAVMRGDAPLAPDQRERLVAQYDAEIAYLDSELGRLFSALRRAGLWGDLLLIVTSDHGEAFGEHQLMGHAASVDQSQVYVPLLIKRPGRHRSSVQDAWVSSVDVLPTVLEVVGLPTEAPLPGHALVGRPPGPQRSVLAESYPAGDLIPLGPRLQVVERAIFQGPWKLVWSSGGSTRLWRVSPPDGEREAPQGTPGVRAHLEALLHQQLAAQVPAQPSAESRPNAATRERLRALGYGS